MADGGRVQDDGQHHQEGHGPDAEAEEERDARCAVLEGPDRVADGQVAVCAHDSQGEDPGEQVDGEEHEVDLAHGEAEHPVLQDGGGGQERQADDEEHVGDGQVENVHVGDRLHLGVTQHHVDHQPVAQPAQGQDDYVADGADPREHLVHHGETRVIHAGGVAWQLGDIGVVVLEALGGDGQVENVHGTQEVHWTGGHDLQHLIFV